MSNITTILGIVKNIILKRIIDIFFLISSIYIIIFGNVTYIENAEIIFLNVGQGDSILIQQQNYQILIDSGPDDSVIYSLSKYMPWYDKKIELVILTHPHEDHMVGLYSILQTYQVEKILYNPVEYENKGYNYILENYSDILVEVNAGDYFKYMNIYGVVLYPFEEDKIQDSNLNNESVAILLYINDYKILLMGDSEIEVEEKLLKYSIIENIDLLKVGHHCSSTSTSDMFLNLVKPSIAICSCSRDNNFGHPDSGTLKKFKNSNVQYLITYEEGDIKFIFN